MTTGMIVFWVVVGVLLLAWWLVIQAKHPIDAPESRQDRLKELLPGVSELFKAEYDKYKEAHEQAPYKLEPSNASDLVAVSDQPKKRGRPLGSKNKPRKRPYTKRSPYWTSGKLKVKMAKARKARRKQNRKLK